MISVNLVNLLILVILLISMKILITLLNLVYLVIMVNLAIVVNLVLVNLEFLVIPESGKSGLPGDYVDFTDVIDDSGQSDDSV